MQLQYFRVLLLRSNYWHQFNLQYLTLNCAANLSKFLFWNLINNTEPKTNVLSRIIIPLETSSVIRKTTSKVCSIDLPSIVRESTVNMINMHIQGESRLISSVCIVQLSTIMIQFHDQFTQETRQRSNSTISLHSKHANGWIPWQGYTTSNGYGQNSRSIYTKNQTHDQIPRSAYTTHNTTIDQQHL